MANQPGARREPFGHQSETTATQTNLFPAVRITPGATNLGRCPSCGAHIPPGTSICPECGERLRATAKKIRCRRCGQRTSSNLVLCPHCGRELLPAPPRLLQWGAPSLLVALFMLALVGRWQNGNLLTWTQHKVVSGVVWFKTFGDSLAPSINVSIAAGTPAPVAVAQSTNQAEQTEPSPPSSNGQDQAEQTQNTNALQPPAVAIPITQTTVAEVAPLTVTATTADTPTPEPTLVVAPTTAPTLEPTATVTPIPATATPPPTATATTPPTATNPPTPSKPTAASRTTAAVHASLVIVPTETPTIQTRTATTVTVIAIATKPAAAPTPTLTVTATDTPAPTNTSSAGTTYTVQAGDTLNAIANRFNTTNQAIMAANGLTNNDVYRLRPGQSLLIPGDASASAEATATPASGLTYTIQAGDTPIEIANTYGITVAALLAANQLSAEDARNLRVGQVLNIPGANSATATETPQVTDTPTGAAQSTPAVTPSPQATGADEAKASSTTKLRLDAPQLRSPENNVSVSCNSSNALTWQTVPFMLDSDRFVLHLGFVNGRDADGKEVVRWLLEQIQSPNNTAWHMDNNLCALAPQTLGRQWRWYVEVVDASQSAVSPPSAIWAFSWN